jgi:2-polyprenyl-6-methoxyphenol hydroxylase-like FAD-dependent oxidoreductase
MLGADVRVLVVGAGIAATRTLRDWGAAVEIVERQPDPPGEGAGIYLLGNAVRALDTLWVGDQVAERTIHIRQERTADHRGRALFEVDIDQLWDGVGPWLALPPDGPASSAARRRRHQPAPRGRALTWQ